MPTTPPTTAGDVDLNDFAMFGSAKPLPPLVGITEPSNQDVLCGRGGAALRHPGNQTYRRLVHLNKGLYITCLKAEKLKISKSIVAAIREQSGRFLEKSDKTTWYDIGDKKAMEKTSQALREGQPKLRQKIVELGGGAAGAAALLEAQFPGGQLYNLQAQPQSTSNPNLVVARGDGSNTAKTNNNNNNTATEQQLQRQQQALAMQQQQADARLMTNEMLQDAMARANSARSDVSAELLQRLSLHDVETSNTNLSQQQPQQRDGLVQQQTVSDLSLLSSGFGAAGSGHSYGMSDTSLTFEQQQQLHRNSLISAALEAHPMSQEALATITSGHTIATEAEYEDDDCNDNNDDKATSSKTASFPSLDRRKYFAKTKFQRPASGRFSSSSKQKQSNSSQKSMGDGMPDIFLVESGRSLFSNMSSVEGGGDFSAITAKSSKEDGQDLASKNNATATVPDVAHVFESKRSLMSGLSRISDTTDMNSIFSDLSKKIGNVSTRSIAMSEISNMEDVDSASTPPASGGGGGGGGGMEEGWA